MDAALPERDAAPARRRVRWWSRVEATASAEAPPVLEVAAYRLVGLRAGERAERPRGMWRVGSGSVRGVDAARREAGGGCERVKLDAISRRLDRRLGGERGGRGRRTRTHLCRGLRAILAVVRVSAVVSKACALRCGRSEHGLVGVSRLPRSRATHPHARVGPPASKALSLARRPRGDGGSGDLGIGRGRNGAIQTSVTHLEKVSAHLGAHPGVRRGCNHTVPPPGRVPSRSTGEK